MEWSTGSQGSRLTHKDIQKVEEKGRHVNADML